MPDKTHFEPGDSALEFTLKDFQEIVKGVKNLVKPPVVAPLEWANDSLHLSFVEGFYAKLIGTANPYGMAEQFGDTNGTWANRVRECDACAYEVNDVPNLNAKEIWLEPGAPGEYVGQWVGSGGHTPPCMSATACIRFNPICAFIVTGISVTMTFTPTDPLGIPVTVTGSALTLCLTHVGAGTIAWSFSSDNYFDASGSFPVTECGDGGGPTVDVYPNTYKVCIFGCNIVTDGTAVTITASGSFSDSCTPTATVIPAGEQFAGTPALCCTFDLDEPIMAAPTITVTADRYKVLTPYVFQCGAKIVMQAADGYFCCNDGAPDCKPIKCTLTLSSPVGDFHIDMCSTGMAPTATATVLGRPNVAHPYFIECGCDSAGPLAGVPVTFYLVAFQCTISGWIGTIEYQACPLNSSSLDCAHIGDGNDWVAAEDGFTFCLNEGSGVYQFSLTGECPPGEVGVFGGEGCHNRYLSGTYVLTES